MIDTRDDIFSAMRGYHIGFQGDILRFYYPVVKVDGRVFIPIYDSLRLALRFLGEGERIYHKNTRWIYMVLMV